MATIVSATATVGGVQYRVIRGTDGNRVSIDRYDDGAWVWSGDGRWSSGATGARVGIYDCAADLGDEVYDALDEALEDAIAEVS